MERKQITIKLNEPKKKSPLEESSIRESFIEEPSDKHTFIEETMGERATFEVDDSIDDSIIVPFQYGRHDASPRPHLPLSHYQKRKKQKRDWQSPNTANYYQTTTKKSQFKARIRVLLITAAAISLGLMMGMTVLSIFSNLGDQTVNNDAEGISQPRSVEVEKEVTANAGGQQQEAGLGEADSDLAPIMIPSGSIEGRSIELPARSYYVVQAGAFSEIEMAREASQSFQGQGWASLLLDDQSPYRLYTGVAMNKEDALLLGTFYHDQKVEIYVKEHVLPSKMATIEQGDEQSLALLPSFLAKGDQLLAHLGKASTTGIVNKGLDLSDVEWKQIQELHRTFLQEGQVLLSKWSGDSLQAGQRMQHALTEGIDALERYRQQQHSAYLWKVQQSALNYLQASEHFLASL